VRLVMGGGLRGVVLSSLLGFATPLCSCTVLPIAMGLRRSGAGSGSVASFIVSAPALSPVSLSLSLALLGPRITGLYVATVMASSIATGAAIEAISSRSREEGYAAQRCSSCSLEHHHGPRRGFIYAFAHMIREVLPWSLAGLAAATAITMFAPPATSTVLACPIGIALSLAISLPIYICSASAIPIAAGLAEKGMCLGGVLTFMVLGPATNPTNIAIVTRMLGKRAGATYVATLIATTLTTATALTALTAP